MGISHVPEMGLSPGALVGEGGWPALEEAGGYPIEVLLGLIRDAAEGRSLGLRLDDAHGPPVDEKEIISASSIER